MPLDDPLLSLPRIGRVLVADLVIASLLPFLHIDTGTLPDLDSHRRGAILAPAVSGPELKGLVHVPEQIDEAVVAFDSNSRARVLQQALQLDAPPSQHLPDEPPAAAIKGLRNQRLIQAGL